MSSHKHFENKDAEKYYTWQQRQRERSNLAPNCLKTLDRVKTDARMLERQQIGSNNYRKTLNRLRTNKDRFYRQLKAIELQERAKRREQKEYNSPIPSINLTCYTQEAWIKMGGKLEEYLDSPKRFSLDVTVFSALDNLGIIDDDYEICTAAINGDTIIRLVPIDEENYSWLEKDGGSDDAEHRIHYATTVNSNDAYRFLVKNHMNYSYTLCLIPVILFPMDDCTGTIRPLLTYNTKKLLKTRLAKLFGEDNLYFPGIVCDLISLSDQENQFLEYAEQSFNGNEVTPINFASPGVYDYGTLAEYICVPFVVRYEHKSAERRVQDILEGYDESGKVNPCLCPDLVLFDDDDCEGDEEEEELPQFLFDENGLRDRILKNFAEVDGLLSAIYSGWITTTDIEDFVSEMEETIYTFGQENPWE